MLLQRLQDLNTGPIAHILSNETHGHEILKNENLRVPTNDACHREQQQSQLRPRGSPLRRTLLPPHPVTLPHKGIIKPGHFQADIPLCNFRAAARLPRRPDRTVPWHDICGGVGVGQLAIACHDGMDCGLRPLRREAIACGSDCKTSVRFPAPVPWTRPHLCLLGVYARAATGAPDGKAGCEEPGIPVLAAGRRRPSDAARRAFRAGRAAAGLVAVDPRQRRTAPLGRAGGWTGGSDGVATAAPGRRGMSEARGACAPRGSRAPGSDPGDGGVPAGPIAGRSAGSRISSLGASA